MILKTKTSTYMHLLSYAFVLCMLLLNSLSITANAEGTIKKISWKQYDKELTIEKGEKKKLKVKYSPNKASNKKLRWSSSKKKVVTVTSDGVIKGKKKGKATITAKTTDGSNKTLKLKVTVGTKVTSVKLEEVEDIDTLYVGKTYKFKTSVAPDNASNKGITWVSSNKKIAAIDKKGKIKVIAPGTVTITAKAADGSGNKSSKKFRVIVPVKSISLDLDKTTAYCVSINSTGAYVMKGTEFSLKSEVKPENATNKKLTWSSSNPKVAVVTNSGKVTTVGCGVASIIVTATDGTEKETKFTVSVNSYSRDECEFTAHRGYSDAAPANSLAAFRLAMENNFDSVEFDIWNTTDGRFAVSHEDSLKKMCGADVKITELTLAQAMTYHINSGNGLSTYPNEYVASLDQVLSLAALYPNTKLTIEIKPKLTDELIKALLTTVNNYKMMERVKFISFEKSNLGAIRKMTELGGDEVALAYISKKGDEDAVKFCIDCKAELCAEYVCITKEVVKTMHKNDLTVTAWTVPNIYVTGFLIDSMKVDGITSNYKFFQ